MQLWGEIVSSVVLGVAVAACNQASPDTGPDETACPEAEERLGRRVCVHAIPDDDTWTSITFAAAAVDQDRVTTYLIPAHEDARVPSLFVDATAFEMPEQSLHFKFLTESFPELASLDYEEYVELVRDPERREWYGGSLTEFLVADSDPLFGFTVYDPAMSSDTTVTCDEIRALHENLAGRITDRHVAFVPATDFQRDAVANCDVPFHDPSTALDYEPYTRETGCGTLRRYTLAELSTAEQNAEFGWQDILIVDQAPLDIATVISGIVTGTRQGELSHLNVRSASRGTPNCYVKDAYELLAQWEGQLVELDCGATRATVVAITPEEAQACWEGLRPQPVDVVPADLEWTELTGLLELPTETPEDRLTAVGRYGSKGSNLAALYQRIDPDLQLEGFLIPFYYYDQFLSTNGFDATIEGLLADPDFLSDGAVRGTELTALRDAMELAPCDADLIAAIEAEILATFGGDDTMVRFRSSSNAEDALGFNGAGLYDSTSVCLADETDSDDVGPSRCDADKSSERDVCRGLRRVWASIWNLKAFEERDWYGIDHARVAMGVLVNTRTKNEQANIVAFTGNPLLQGDDRYLINAQLGELDVVAAQPGVWPEKNLLTVEGGVVTTIERERGSTELPEGQWVLDDARLRELGGHLFDILEAYPVDEDVPVTADVLLDTEWKLRPDGRLAIKQVRPFLR